MVGRCDPLPSTDGGGSFFSFCLFNALCTPYNGGLVSTDVQIAFPQVVVSLSSVRTLPGATPRALDVYGADFSAVDSVVINGQPSPEVIVVSKTRLLARVPDSLQKDTLTSVSVISSELTISPESLIRFRLGRTASKVSGILRLVQLFLKILFTSTSSDIFAPRIGGNALRNLGLTFGKDQGGAIVSDFVIAVGNTQRQITAIQARDTSIPRDERLLTAKVTKAGYNRAEATLVVSVELTSQAGRAATANVSL